MDNTGYISTGYQNEPGWMVEVRISPNVEKALVLAGLDQYKSRNAVVDGAVHAHFEALDTEIHNAFDDYQSHSVFVSRYTNPITVGIVTIIHNEQFELFVVNADELDKVQWAVNNSEETVDLGWVNFEFHRERSLYMGEHGYAN